MTPVVYVFSAGMFYVTTFFSYPVRKITLMYIPKTVLCSEHKIWIAHF